MPLGNGKTHYIRKRMHEASVPCATLVVNEAFDYSVAIDLLNALERLQNCTVHINITVVPPLTPENERNTQNSTVRDSLKLTLYVPITAILDIWKNTRVSVLSYISLPVNILYDNPHIFLKLIKFVSF